MVTRPFALLTVTVESIRHCFDKFLSCAKWCLRLLFLVSSQPTTELLLPGIPICCLHSSRSTSDIRVYLASTDARSCFQGIPSCLGWDLVVVMSFIPCHAMPSSSFHSLLSWLDEAMHCHLDGSFSYYSFFSHQWQAVSLPASACIPFHWPNLQWMQLNLPSKVCVYTRGTGVMTITDVKLPFLPHSWTTSATTYTEFTYYKD